MPDRLDVQRRLEPRQLTRGSHTHPARPPQPCARSLAARVLVAPTISLAHRRSLGSPLADSLLAVPQAVVGWECWRWDGITALG
jgi:hypothetical protein